MIFSLISKNIKKICIIVVVAPYLFVLNMLLSGKKVEKEIKYIGNVTEQQIVINDLWEEILTVSEDQLLIKKETLIKTLQFMLQEVDEEDPKLIKILY
jgi:hypothetical protein